MTDVAVGVDIGASWTKFVVVDTGGELVRHRIVATPSDQNSNRLVRRLIGNVRSFMREALEAHHRLLGVGFSVPQFVDGPRWIQRAANNMPALEGIALYAPLRDAFGPAIAMANDVSAAAVAEHRFGRGRGVSRLLLMAIGTGSSIGVVIDGQLLQFTWGTAGDAGQIIVDPSGLRCTCGGRGCLDTVAAAPAIRRVALEIARKRPTSSLGRLLTRTGALDVMDVAALARAGDETANSIFQRAGRFVGIALTTYTHIFRPEVIVLAGGVAMSGGLLLRPIRRTIKELGSPFHTRSLRRVVVSAFPRHGASLGAASLILRPEKLLSRGRTRKGGSHAR